MRDDDFSFDAEAIERHTELAQRREVPVDAAALLDSIEPHAPLDPMDLALLWHAPIPTEAIYATAGRVKGAAARKLETFSPLYLTNTCDAECKMCGMRRNNMSLLRETADDGVVVEQLELLMRRGMHAVALLTGEYRGSTRAWAMGYVNRALRAAQARRFKHVLINVGSIDPEEFDVLLDGITRSEQAGSATKFTMSTFQETYSPAVYAKFMGGGDDNPRADFQRRLVNFDRAWRAGLRVANPGILLGLNPNLAYELTVLALHTRHLLARGMEVYLSVPRLRRVSGGASHGAASDDEFVRLVCLLSLTVPQAKIVLTTRENQAIQRRLAPVITVISAGSASVVPYTSDGARFELATSQFEVIDQRPFEAILNDHRAAGATIANFEPPAA